MEEQEIKEGLAKIKTSGNVFFNPVQEFNRDLSILVLRVFADKYKEEISCLKLKNKQKNLLEIKGAEIPGPGVGIKNENGLKILEALSATGLRSIRYAKEISGVKEVIANDVSVKAVEDIKKNVELNEVGHLVTPRHADAVMLMYEHRKNNSFDVIDLDPYGCPSIFLDSTVQAVQNGGLLLVTATDMAVLAGNCPETCYSKYGAVSLKIKSCHEMAIRILLQCIETHANRYSRYIVPLLSISVDFYIRVFVRVYISANECKKSLSKLSTVYHCTGCDSFTLQPLGVVKKLDKGSIKFGLPHGPPVSPNCEHCNYKLHIGGPIWSAPLHCTNFVKKLLENVSDNLGTHKRIQGILTVISEELHDTPLYYTLEKLCGVLHVETPPMFLMRSAILNAGYKTSFTHMNKTAIKTNAPTKVIWDIMRCWQKKHPVNEKRLTENSVAANILKIESEKEYSFDYHSDANPESRRSGLLRFQINPSPFWGPGVRATSVAGDGKMLKSRKNQGKRKRSIHSEENE